MSIESLKYSRIHTNHKIRSFYWVGSSDNIIELKEKDISRFDGSQGVQTYKTKLIRDYNLQNKIKN